MLKPFQIRNLRVPAQHPPQQPADSRTSSGVVQISATDYDNLASNHPRARLTYMDDEDDDETITVGSALELSQRLEEPLDLNSQLESVEHSPDDISPMHIFDIRRSNSVTDLWKRFEDNVPEQGTADEKNGTQATSKAVVLEGQHEVPAPHITSSPPISRDQPRPFMEAFEAELAEMLNASESSESRVPQPDSPPTTEPSANTNSGRSPHPVEILAAQVLDQLINGATMVKSEWRSKMPELQRQLQNAQRQFEAAQRSLPENVESSLRTLLATVEAHLRTAFNNLPDGGRQMAEDAFQAGRPVAENAADGFRTMASELNEVGRTLFAAFESEFGRARPTTSTSTSTSEAHILQAQPQTRNQQQAQANRTHLTLHIQEYPPSKVIMVVIQIIGHLPRGLLHFGIHSKLTTRPPPPCPPLPSASLPNFNCWPQGPPAPPPPPPGFNTPLNARQTSQVKSEESKNSSTTKSLFIGNVGFKVTDKMIQDVFAAKGFLVKVDLPLDTTSGRHAGFGYVNFPSDYPALAAMEALQGAVIDGHSINLEPMYHPAIESVRPAQISPNTTTTAQDTQGNGPRVNVSGVKNPRSEQNSTTLGPSASPLAVKSQKTPSQAEKTDNRRKSVSFVDLTQDTDSGPPQTESFALLDSPSDDPAFSARFPSLLPETSAQLSDQGVSSYSNTESRFPPVSQWEAQLLANGQEHRETELMTGVLHSQSPKSPKHREGLSTHILPVHPTPKGFGQSQPASGANKAVRPVVGLNDPHHAAKLKRRATEHKTHKPNHLHAVETGCHHHLRHSTSMRRPGDRSYGPAETDTWARLSRRERNAASSHEQVPGSFPMEDTTAEVTTRAQLSSTLDASVPETDNAAIERCVSALIDMGYGAGQEGGRSRMAVYAAMVDGVLMDAIDMIEEERQVYERRPSQ
ncbi:Nucleotide-binding alpha-beta plait [Penicillium fimorum]|uniref:Nucleotide-binding alpha-beta plait n=1 Tax=Penicillium fimorum TaxID=1882269 RepID=A0A9W9Y1X3_9EURO|nr:Nucleotide-binding alpha-beta plait [Penicillium fimorum]